MNSGALKRLKVSLLTIALYTLCSALYLSFSGQAGARDWRTASREPGGLAPDPADTQEAVVQVYAARAARWRGYFGVHTWIAVKRSGAQEFTIHEVMGFRLRRTGTAVVASSREPDGRWYGSRPQLLSDLRGAGVDDIISRIEEAVANYPYPNTYRVWPGPNSNTFVAFVTREVPELRVDLPPTAIGKDYLGVIPVGTTPSGTGAQLSLFGAAGVLVGLEEGVEVNVLGLTFGVDPKSLSIKLPLLGRIGPRRDAKPGVLEPKQDAVPAQVEDALAPETQPSRLSAVADIALQSVVADGSVSIAP
ncbi:MAG TPA: DUF3750 domain-containing protein [Steroidobacteraceae bacterium]|nr:DUF3750 domain-containing protein [Steroidobacteraceae bacterium]